jgi:tetratricopeptide (TPR) repeat protein
VGTLSDLRAVGILERIGLACYGVVFYAWKTLLPARLSPLYEAPHDYAGLTPWFLGSGVVVAAVAAALVAGRHRWPGLAGAGAAFVVLLLPVLGLLRFGLHIAADRNTYFAGLAVAMLAGGVILHLLGAGRSVAVARCTVATALAVVLVLSVLTWRQSQVWRDSRTLWAHALAVSPSSVAHAKVGVLLDEEGRTEEAIAHFREALRLRPDNAYAENNWGVALANVWRFSEAIARFEAALRIQPNYAEAHRNLQLTLVRMANPLGYLDAHRAGREGVARGAAVSRITPAER